MSHFLAGDVLAIESTPFRERQSTHSMILHLDAMGGQLSGEATLSAKVCST